MLHYVIQLTDQRPAIAYDYLHRRDTSSNTALYILLKDYAEGSAPGKEPLFFLAMIRKKPMSYDTGFFIYHAASLTLMRDHDMAFDGDFRAMKYSTAFGAVG